MNRFGAELRAEVSGNRLAGHAAVFDVLADLPQHYEALARTAFDEALKGDPDVKALFNHNPSELLGSTRGKTLRLATDSTGLQFELDLPDTPDGHKVRTLVERGDLSGMSFGFLPGESEWSRARDGRQIRTHTSVKRLLDVSPVSYPAYDGTEVHLRAVQFAAPVLSARSRMVRLRAAALLKGIR